MKASPALRLLRAGWACFFLVSAGARLLAAQDVSGRWAIMLRGGVAGTLRGELLLSGQRGQLGGSIWFEDMQEPAAVRGTQDGNLVQFVAALPTDIEFRGNLQGSVLRGVATDSDAGRPWTAARLRPEAEYYPVLPRFTLRQVIAGRQAGELRVPGPWAAAAHGKSWGNDSAYAALAQQTGLERLRGGILEQLGPLRALGGARRSRTTAVSIATLSAIRQQIPSPQTRARFDRIFRPRGGWITDLHDAAVFLARAGSPGLAPGQAAPALDAVGWLSGQTPAEDAIPQALYRLYALQSTDSSAAAMLLAAMHDSTPASAATVSRLLGAYEAASAWHVAALRFLVSEPWIAEGSSAHSVADMMQRSWAGRVDSVSVPEIRSHVFGYPQAVPLYGVPGSLFPRLVRTENRAAHQWMERHHGAGLLEVLRRLPVDFGRSAELETAPETFRITSVRQQAEQSINGFLEPRDAILLDPGYMPLMALGAVVHEWQHLLEERRRRLVLAGGAGETLVLPAIHPFIAEGIAERRTELLLAPLVARFPMLGFAEVEKRVRLAGRSRDEHHVLGYAMVRALEEAVPAEPLRDSLLALAGNDPAAAAGTPVLMEAWKAHAAAPELTFDAPSRRVLVPETTFTIEDRFPDVIGTRLVIPVAASPETPRPD